MKRVMILHTGGTLGMTGTPLEPGEFATRLTERVPELSQIAELESQTVTNLDSSDIHPGHWTDLAHMVARERENFDGFVVIHGTDTMAYTAGALAFALCGLDRPVILTGAQRPLAALRSDARRNLADAVELATCDIPEVAICFDGMLFRGCCTTKTSASDYRGFDSPGVRPLARLGVDIQLSPDIRRSAATFECRPEFDRRVIQLPLIPGIVPEMLDHMLRAPELQAAVLIAFGLGTIPSTDFPIAEVLDDAIARGVSIVVISQSLGEVDFGRYQNSLALAEIGAISGKRMNVEAAITKTMHALSLYPEDLDSRREYLETDQAGEMG